MRFLILIAMSCLLCSQLQAATVVKCQDAAGHITFAQNACPDSGVGETVNVQNTRPSGSGADVRLAPPMPKYVAPRVVQYVAPPPVQDEPVEVAKERVTTTPSRGGNVLPRYRVGVGEQRINTTRRNADGSTTGRSEIRKVPVLIPIR